jgi:hypothetical protein
MKYGPGFRRSFLFDFLSHPTKATWATMLCSLLLLRQISKELFFPLDKGTIISILRAPGMRLSSGQEGDDLSKTSPRLRFLPIIIFRLKTSASHRMMHSKHTVVRARRSPPQGFWLTTKRRHELSSLTSW